MWLLHKSVIFEKQRHYRTLYIKEIFDISKLFIECNTDSCCEHIAGGVNVYLYGCVSLLAPVCGVCLCVCDIK